MIKNRRVKEGSRRLVQLLASTQSARCPGSSLTFIGLQEKEDRQRLDVSAETPGGSKTICHHGSRSR